MSSTVLYKTRCPKCAEQYKDTSGDNLAVYSDGHSYCYSCGYITSSSHKRASPVAKIPQEINLPGDIDWTLPPEPTKWLLKYFDYKDIPKYTWWSEEKQSLIFGIYDDLLKPTSLLAYQARYFGDNPKHPKWIGYGISSSLIFTVGKKPGNTSLVLVEDLLSTYKVGHILETQCLFGSHIGHKRLARIALLGYTKVYIWLDEDKRMESLTEASRGISLGLDMKVIHTNKDPKEYSYEEIKSILS